MKVIAINGSPRKLGNTYNALKIMEQELISANIDFEILDVGNKKIHGCLACRKCIENKNRKCSIDNDIVNLAVEKISEADGLIIASPVYYSGIAGTMKCFLDRTFYVAGANGALFRQKVATTVVAVRRSGGSTTFDALNHFLNVSEMIIVSSNYWNIIHGRNEGEATQDTEGVQTLKLLAKNMAWIINMKEATKLTIPPPEFVKKEYMSFIR